jgi:hypothetical protein
LRAAAAAEQQAPAFGLPLLTLMHYACVDQVGL